MPDRHPLLDEDLRRTNFADNPKVKKDIEDRFIPLIKRIRTDRQTVEQDWLDYYNIWLTNPTNRYYIGRANIFVGVVRKSIERWTGRIARSLIPSDEYFSVTADSSQDEAASQAYYAVEKHYLERLIRLKRLLKPHIRQLLIFGTSPLKTYYKKDTQWVVAREKTQEGSEESISTVVKNVMAYDGPAVMNVPLFNVYVWPETSPDVGQAQVVFEDMLISEYTYSHKQKTGWYSPKIVPVPATMTSADQFYAQQQILSNLGFSDLRKEGIKEKFFAITQMWTLWDLLNLGYPQKVVISINNDAQCVQVRPHPFWKQEPPYFFSRIGVQPGEFYGHGLIEPVKEQQYELNDRTNQNLDNTSIINNPVISVDPDEVQDLRELQFSPGAKWGVKPESVKQIQITDTTQSGYAASQMIYGMIQDQINPGPMSMPRSPKSRSAAVLSQGAIEADMEVLEVAQEIEEDVLVPMLGYHHSLLEQFMSDDVILSIAGPKGRGITQRIIKPEDILGSFKYRWLGSQSAMNLHVRVQQMIVGMNVIAKLPLPSDLTINWKFLIEKFWRDGLGFKDDDRIIVDVSDIPSIDPELENETAEKGIDALKVSPKDNDREHLQSHDVALGLSFGEAKRILKMHIEEHVFSVKLKQEQQAQAKRQQLMQAMGIQHPQPEPEKKGRGKDRGVRNVPSSADPSQILKMAMT